MGDIGPARQRYEVLPVREVERPVSAPDRDRRVVTVGADELSQPASEAGERPVR